MSEGTAAVDLHNPMHRPAPAWTARVGSFAAFGVLAVGLIYAILQLLGDLKAVPQTSFMPFLLLGLALFIALSFEFVNGFHDTANAVATVIYTNSMPPYVAVIWSGFFNFLGVLTSKGTVAFTILSLLPVELILQVGSDSGFAMVFALLIAAIIWNVGTWAFGLPASSSHTMVGSIIGVGIANQLMAGPSGTSGVDWGQAAGVGKSLLASPIFGFVLAALLLLVVRRLLPIEALFKAPKRGAPPPLWIRGILIATCTGVSFFHGSNDGQKGMGLIMLILVGTVPTAYALNHTVDKPQIEAFNGHATKVEQALAAHGGTKTVADARAAVTDAVRLRAVQDDTLSALNQLIASISKDIAEQPTLAMMPTSKTSNVRNDMYLASEAMKLIGKTPSVGLSDTEKADMQTYKDNLDKATRFIPDWVKVAVAIALGLGTMVGWKRIVVTVGEKIGKSHLTYAQGASAEIVAAATIGAADGLGLPVSTTHVLASGVAGTMAANGSGLQWSTVRNLALAWVLTLPAAMLLSGILFWIFRHTF